MPYRAELNRDNPACLLFLVDQSESMAEVMDLVEVPQHGTATADRPVAAPAVSRGRSGRGAGTTDRLLANPRQREPVEPRGAAAAQGLLLGRTGVLREA